MDHGLLLTKRPSSLAISAAPASGLEKVSIGNYKGVMLCNRPFSGVPDITSKRQRHSSNSGAGQGDAFVCGTVAKPWGIGSNVNKTGEEKSKVISRITKKDSALTKHKKWLKRMQEERERLEKERGDETRMRDERKREFMEKQAKVRSVVLEEAAGGAESNKQAITEQDDRKGHVPLDCRTENFLPSRSESGNSAKPAWALTESAAKVVDEAAETQEQDDLLSFVDDLDFDRYSHDLELKVLMQQVKDRIHALQKEKNIDEGRLKAVMDSEVASIRAEQFNSLSEDGLTIIGDDGNVFEDLDDDIRSMAESVRSEGSVSCVHSQRSMEALVARSRERITDGGQLGGITECPPQEEEGIEPPKLVTHIEDEGARLAETKSLNKLPFKNRNPAL